MSELRFDWDEQKNVSNQAKYENVSFEEARGVFDDVNAVVIDDPIHSDDEDRFIILGLSGQARLLVVCHCYREDNKIIRIISARKATKNEWRFYGR